VPAERSDLVDPDSSSGAPSIDLGGLVAVASGGFLGTLARYGVDRAWTSRPGRFPLATFSINVSGALAIAVVLVVIVERRSSGPRVRPFLATGVLGGWTTMSTLAVDSSTLARHGHLAVAAGYVGATLAASLVAVSLGARVARGWPPGSAPNGPAGADFGPRQSPPQQPPQPPPPQEGNRR
jgi:CrcB protein